MIDGFFNGSIENRDDLLKLSKEELVDLILSIHEQDIRFITMIFDSDKETFNGIKSYWKCLMKNKNPS